MFVVVMVSAVQCMSLDKVKVYGMASLVHAVLVHV